MIHRALQIAAILIALCADHAFAQQPEPVATMQLVDGDLVGAGADLLRAKMPTSQFVMIGEEHGFADSPEIALALSRAARPLGINHLVLEIGPSTDEIVTASLRAGGEEELAALLAGRPLAVPFVNLAEDARLADYFIDQSNAIEDPIWGVDQEFIGAPLIFLERLLELASSPEAAAAVRSWLDKERQAFASGELGSIMLMNAKTDDFAELAGMFVNSSEARVLIRGLEESAKIYRLYNSGANYGSNATRVALMRRQFLAAYRASPEPAPRAVFKLGANHVALGSGTLNTFDLGSLTEGIAAANGLDVLRILIFPLEGTQTVVNPAADGAFDTVDFRSTDVADILESAGIAEYAIPLDGYAVIPMDTVRAHLEQKGLSELPPDTRFLVLGYDFLITTRRARPATPLAH